MVEKLEAMTPDERYAFWRGELSRCIRCNACRNICPACSCEQCVFDNPASGVSQKAAADSFEENMFHIIRAFQIIISDTFSQFAGPLMKKLGYPTIFCNSLVVSENGVRCDDSGDAAAGSVSDRCVSILF